MRFLSIVLMFFEAPALANTCLNKDFTLSTARRHAENLMEPPQNLSDLAVFNSPLFAGRRTLEIGGPTPFAESFYSLVAEGQASSDLFTNVVYPLVPPPAPGDGDPFLSSSGRRLGTCIRRHGAHLHGLSNRSFELIFASHSLEHFLNPVAALVEWDRVLAPGGLLFLILPFAPKTYDADRAVSSAQELLWISSDEQDSQSEFVMNARASRFVKERRLIWDWPGKVERPPGADKRQMTPTQLRASVFGRCESVTQAAIKAVNGPAKAQELLALQAACVAERRETCDAANDSDACRSRGHGDIMTKEDANFLRADEEEASLMGHTREGWLVDESEVHWHVFDFNLLDELTEGCLGYSILHRGFQAPYHQLVLAQKPGRT